MVSLSHKVSEGFSEQVAFKGVTGEAKEAVRAVWGGDNFRQRENRSTALRQEPPLSLETSAEAPERGRPRLSLL